MKAFEVLLLAMLAGAEAAAPGLSVSADPADGRKLRIDGWSAAATGPLVVRWLPEPGSDARPPDFVSSDTGSFDVCAFLAFVGQTERKADLAVELSRGPSTARLLLRNQSMGCAAPLPEPVKKKGTFFPPPALVDAPRFLLTPPVFASRPSAAVVSVAEIVVDAEWMECVVAYDRPVALDIGSKLVLEGFVRQMPSRTSNMSNRSALSVRAAGFRSIVFRVPLKMASLDPPLASGERVEVTYVLDGKTFSRIPATVRKAAP